VGNRKDLSLVCIRGNRKIGDLGFNWIEEKSKRSYLLKNKRGGAGWSGRNSIHASGVIRRGGVRGCKFEGGEVMAIFFTPDGGGKEGHVQPIWSAKGLAS